MNASSSASNSTPALPPAAPPIAPRFDYDSTPVLHVVATAHLDTQWNWTIQKTIREYILNTLRDNFARFEQDPDYQFSFEGAFRYALMREYYPADYERMKGYIAAGRWHVCGSSWDAGDVNIPSIESLMRNILYGNGYFQREFGKTSADIFLPDCFGFGWTLPSVAAHMGLQGFSTQKLSWGSAVPRPFSIGMWEGPDGSRILACLRSADYTSKVREDLSHSAAWLADARRNGEAYGLPVEYRYYGVGDMGGAPDAESVRWIGQSVRGAGPLRIAAAPADSLCRELSEAQKDRLPHYRGELLMRQHAVGCYTSQAMMKRWNRINERLADAAERAAVLADWLGAAPYPREKLTAAWQRFLWHQFHDDLTGTSLPEAYTFSWNDEALSARQFAEVLSHGVEGLAGALDTRVKGQALVVFNPLDAEREDVVEARVVFAKRAPKHVRAFGPGGAEVPVQVLRRADAHTLEVALLARVPALGCAVFDLRPSGSPCVLKTGLKAGKRSLANARYTVTFNKQGDVESIHDKLLQRELLDAPHRWELLEQEPTYWAAWEISYPTVCRPPVDHVGGKAQLRVIEDGPVRVALEVRRETAGSTFVQRVRLAAGAAGEGSAADRVEFDNDVDWRTPLRLLKARFQLTARHDEATYDLGLGVVRRPTNSENLYEVPSQGWADLSDKSEKFGVTLFSDYKVGWDKPDARTLRLTLLHAPEPGPKDYAYQLLQDMGRHHFRYALAGHAGPLASAAATQVQARHRQAPVAFQSAPHAGPAGPVASFLELLGDGHAQVRALKRAEDGPGWIVRVQETAGHAGSLRLRLGAGIAAAREVNGFEQGDLPVAVEDGVLLTELRPWQPRTFRVELASVPWPARFAAECRPLLLQGDSHVATRDGEALDPAGDFDGQGRALPAELWPARVENEGVAFELAPTHDAAGQPLPHVLRCRGQKIKLKARKGERLCLLACATEEGTYSFKFDGKATRLSIGAATGWQHQADSLRGPGGFRWSPGLVTPGYLKPHKVAWLATHLHMAAGENEPYVYVYWYEVTVDLPAGCRELRLPDDPRVRIAALSVAPPVRSAWRPASWLMGRDLA